MNYFNQETNRLFLRKLTMSDIESWLEFFIDNNRLHFLGLDTSKSNETLAKEWIIKQLDRYETQSLGLLAAIEKTSGKFIGMCGIIPREILDQHELEIGYSLKPAYWGKGYATELALQMKKFGFDTKLTNRFISIIHKENVESMNVARKNKMEIIAETNYLGMEVFVFGTREK